MESRSRFLRGEYGLDVGMVLKSVVLSCNNVAGKAQLELKCLPKVASVSRTAIGNMMVPEQPIINRWHLVALGMGLTSMVCNRVSWPPNACMRPSVRLRADQPFVVEQVLYQVKHAPV